MPTVISREIFVMLPHYQGIRKIDLVLADRVTTPDAASLFAPHHDAKGEHLSNSYWAKKAVKELIILPHWGNYAATDYWKQILPLLLGCRSPHRSESL